MIDGTPKLYRQGEHLCMLYTRPEEQLISAVEYIRGGLERGERCFFICGECSAEQLRDVLNARGIDTAYQERRGALILKESEAYFIEGKFDPDAMILLLDRAVKESLDAGYNGLCSAGDMSWLLNDTPGSNRLAEYEARLNEFAQTHKVILLCFYNCKTIPLQQLDHALATHQHIEMGLNVRLDNPFREPDYIAVGRKAGEPEIVTEKLDILDAMRLAAQA